VPADLLTDPIVVTVLLGGSCLATIVTIWLAGALAARPDNTGGDTVRRVFRNSAVPVASQLAIRGVDLLVAIVLLRLLGPAGNGQYALAVIIWLYVKTLSDFGLSLLVTRDVARDPSRIGWLVGATTMFRWLALGLALVPTLMYVGVRWERGGIADDGALAILLLLVSIVPASYGEAVSSALNGLQRMELAAWINIGVSLARAPAAVVLAATSLGVVGVALVGLLMAGVSAVAFRFALRGVYRQPIIWRLPAADAAELARQSWPLLINALLISLFFRVDVFIVQAARGDAALGIYDAAYKPINLLTILPAYATLAVFPLMAQRADEPARLARAQRLTSYLLVSLAWVIVMAFSALAEPAIRLLAGDAYLPEAATLLRVLIWFAPFSFFNGVFQYVLVATGHQRRIVPVFGAAVAFNLICNLLLVPEYGAYAAAALTVATEVVILVAFLLVGRGSTTPMLSRASAARLWRPTLAGVAGAGLALLLRDHPWLAVSAGSAVILVLAFVLRVIGPEERDVLHRLARR
jgi:O-antigen/teichoic acid export membrane protein